jgi:hypothetical protein
MGAAFWSQWFNNFTQVIIPNTNLVAGGVTTRMLYLILKDTLQMFKPNFSIFRRPH